MDRHRAVETFYMAPGAGLLVYLRSSTRCEHLRPSLVIEPRSFLALSVRIRHGQKPKEKPNLRWVFLLAPELGFEPRTTRLTVERSTAELLRITISYD